MKRRRDFAPRGGSARRTAAEAIGIQGKDAVGDGVMQRPARARTGAERDMEREKMLRRRVVRARIRGRIERRQRGGVTGDGGVAKP